MNWQKQSLKLNTIHFSGSVLEQINYSVTDCAKLMKLGEGGRGPFLLTAQICLQSCPKHTMINSGGWFD